MKLSELLSSNEYPGRGIALGLTPDGKRSAAVYFIMGRSVNSRNRVFLPEPDGIRTEAFDPSKLEDLRRVAGKNVHGLLQQDAAAVGDLVHQMHRGAGDLHALGQGRLMDLQAVHALAAEGGDEGGVHIEDALRPLADKALGQNGEEARQDDDVDLVFRQLQREGGLKGLLAHLLSGDGDTGHAMVGGPGQCVCRFVAGADQNDLPVGDAALLLGLQQGLQVGAAAGDQHGDIGFFQHKVTRSSLSTISPMT